MGYRCALLWLIIMAPEIAFGAAPVLEDITPDTVYARGRVTNLSAEGNSFLKVDMALGTDVTILPGRLTGKFELQIGPAYASFNQGIGEDLTARTKWTSDAFVALYAAGRLTVFRRSWADFGLRLGYEASLFGTEMRPNKFTFKDSSGKYDVTDFAKEHAKLSAGWTRMVIDLDARVPIFDIWTAYASFGLTRYTFSLDLDIDSEGKDLIESIGQNPDAISKSYEPAYIVPTLTIGSDVSIPNLPIYLNAEVVLIPVSIEQLFLGAQLGIGLKL